MTDNTMRQLPPSQRGLVDALTEADAPMTVSQCARWLGQHRALRLGRMAVATALNELAHAGTVVPLDDGHGPRTYVLAEPGRVVA